MLPDFGAFHDQVLKFQKPEIVIMKAVPVRHRPRKNGHPAGITYGPYLIASMQFPSDLSLTLK
jgi:hypothetical protein